MKVSASLSGGGELKSTGPISDIGYLTFGLHNGQAALSEIFPKSAQSERMFNAINLTEEWINKQPAGAYKDPVFVEFPALNMGALWIAGAKEDLFIPIHEFGMNPAAPIRFDSTFLDRVVKADKAQAAAYKKAMKGSKPGMGPLGG